MLTSLKKPGKLLSVWWISIYSYRVTTRSLVQQNLVFQLHDFLCIILVYLDNLYMNRASLDQVSWSSTTQLIQGSNKGCFIQINIRGTLLPGIESRIKERSLRPLFHNLKRFNNLSLFPFHFFQCISSSNYRSSLPGSYWNRYFWYLL